MSTNARKRLAAKPFALTMSVEKYQTNLVTFRKDFENPNNWKDESGASESGWTQEIPVSIVGGFNCTLSAPIQVTPAANIKNFHHRKKSDPSSTPSDLDTGNGFLIAKLTNASDCQTVPLSIGKGTYYWVIRKDPQVPNQPESLIISAVDAKVVQRVTLFRCDGADDTSPHAHDAVAVFTKADVCNREITHKVSSDPKALRQYYAGLRRHSLNVRGKTQTTGFKFIAPDDFALWFTCDLGCCYADRFGT